MVPGCALAVELTDGGVDDGYLVIGQWCAAQDFAHTHQELSSPNQHMLCDFTLDMGEVVEHSAGRSESTECERVESSSVGAELGDRAAGGGDQAAVVALEVGCDDRDLALCNCTVDQ